MWGFVRRFFRLLPKIGDSAGFEGVERRGGGANDEYNSRFPRGMMERTARSKATAGSSAALRFAQDDDFIVIFAGEYNGKSKGNDGRSFVDSHISNSRCGAHALVVI
jgi:hypothetical protein